MNSPMFAEDDFFCRLPELHIDTDSMRAYMLDNLDKFFNMEPVTSSLDSTYAKMCWLPGHFIDEVNEKVRLSPAMAKVFKEHNQLFETTEAPLTHLFSHPFAMLQENGEPMKVHTDTCRAASLNWVLIGDPKDTVTTWEWNGGEVSMQYNMNEATLFNAQIPHRVDNATTNMRLLLSFRSLLSYQHFMALYRQGYIEIVQ